MTVEERLEALERRVEELERLTAGRPAVEKPVPDLVLGPKEVVLGLAKARPQCLFCGKDRTDCSCEDEEDD